MDNIPGKPEEAKRLQLIHSRLDKGLLAALTLAAFKFGDPIAYAKKVFEAVKLIPMHYEPVFDWSKKPMNKFVAVSVWLISIYFLVKTYIVEKYVVDQTHKKYTAHKHTLAVAIHGTGSVLETTLGCLAVCNPANAALSKLCACIALFVNIPTGLILTPGVFGIKHLTVPGFYLMAVVRALEAVRALFYDSRQYPQAWLLLQVGTVVRLLGFFVLPYSSVDGRRGDLFIEPSLYSFNILLSGYLTMAFVYPPKWALMSLGLYAAFQKFYPHRISLRRLPRHEGAEGGPVAVDE